MQGKTAQVDDEDAGNRGGAVEAEGAAKEKGNVGVAGNLLETVGKTGTTVWRKLYEQQCDTYCRREYLGNIRVS